MKRLLISFFLISLGVAAEDIKLEHESAVTTEHTLTVNGTRFPYSATAGTQPVWNEEGKTIASLFYTYYQRSDIKDKDRAERPLLISFNGGPGSASVWMHLAYTGPRVLAVDDEGYPVQPYGVRENPYSVLDVADIVFVNPVNTGYSRIVEGEDKKEKVDRKLFFGVNADIAYLSDWINSFVTRHNRWRSPKYLIGESYGTTRVSGLARALQGRQWMYLNGVILVSPTGLGINRDGPVNDALSLPYFTAAAWYHKRLAPDLQEKDLSEILPEVERFTLDELLPALARGGFVAPERKQAMAAKIAYYSSMSEGVILQNNLAVSKRYFWKELLRDKGLTVGRLDSRYLGIDEKDVGSSPDYNAELSHWLHAFTPAINYYLREHLNYKTDIKYNMFGPVRPWDRDGNNTGKDLRLAMAENPYLHVLVQAGYFDGATDYFSAKYTMWHIDSSGKMKDRFGFEGYRSGHMMYLRREDLKLSNDHLRAFIARSLPGKGKPARY